jgi:hypothetical protein
MRRKVRAWMFGSLLIAVWTMPDTYPRFLDNLDGTVTDRLTGLIWLKNTDCLYGDWTTALHQAHGLADGACGLTDGSEPGDWRLPNIRELASLIDYQNHLPGLPTGHPFSGVQSGGYWSSTTAMPRSWAWIVDFDEPDVLGHEKAYPFFYSWPVRGGR